jgi:hypothetical protein
MTVLDDDRTDHDHHDAGTCDGTVRGRNAVADVRRPVSRVHRAAVLPRL